MHGKNTGKKLAEIEWRDGKVSVLYADPSVEKSFDRIISAHGGLDELVFDEREMRSVPRFTRTGREEFLPRLADWLKRQFDFDVSLSVTQ